MRLLAALLLCCIFVPPAVSSDRRIEAESIFVSGTYGNIAGSRIEEVECDAASGGWAVDGLDIAGEWIAMVLILDSRFCFTDSLCSARTTGQVCHYEVEIRDEHDAVISVRTISTPPGGGT